MSLPAKRKVIIFVEHPENVPEPKDFKLVEEDIPLPSDGFALLKILELSPEPYQRAFMRKAPIVTHENYQIGKGAWGFGVGKIVKLGGGDTFGFKEGDIIQGYIPWADYGTVELNTKYFRKLIEGEDQASALSTSGLVALTAYFGVRQLPFKENEKKTFVISGAAGAVGTLVYEIAKIQAKPHRIVGVAGSPEKLEYLKKLGFDDAVSYKSKTFEEDLKKACPDGIDYYWDNVGGSTTSAVLSLVNSQAQILVCGAISGYGGAKVDSPLTIDWFHLVRRTLHINGFGVDHYRAEFPAAVAELVKFASSA